MARSLVARSVWRVCRVVPVVRLLRCPSTCPDLGRFFCAVFKFYERWLLPVCKTTSPSPPSRWAGRYGRWFMGRRPGKKEGGPRRVPPNQKRWVQGGRTSSSLVFFPPAFFQRKPGSPPESAGPPGRCAPKVLRSYPPVGYAAPCCPWQGDRVWTGAGSGRKLSRGGTTLCYGTQKS